MVNKHMFFETVVGKKFQQFMNIVELNGFNESCKTEYEDLLNEMDRAVVMIEGFSLIVSIVAINQVKAVDKDNFVDAITEIVFASEDIVNKLTDNQNIINPTHSGTNTVN